MSADGADESAADVDALVDEVQLLEKIRAGLDSDPDSTTMVEAVEGLIKERQAELDRSRPSDA